MKCLFPKLFELNQHRFRAPYIYRVGVPIWFENDRTKEVNETLKIEFPTI
jgi:hypothetical protein